MNKDHASTSSIKYHPSSISGRTILSLFPSRRMLYNFVGGYVYPSRRMSSHTNKKNNCMKKLILFLILLILGPTICLSAHEEHFVIGIAPHSSPRLILQMYEPLRLYLEKSLAMPVELTTAPNFDLFATRALAQEYDLVVTTGQQARLLQLDAGYLPLLTYKADFKSLVIGLQNGDINTPADLNDKKVLGLSPTSQVTLWGQHWLKQNQVQPQSVRYVSAADSVAQLLLAKNADAGFVSLANFQRLAPEVRKQLRIIAESEPMLGRVYLLNSRRADHRQAIEAALSTFAGTQKAQTYFTENKLGGYRAIRPGELEAMDVFTEEVRRVINDLK